MSLPEIDKRVARSKNHILAETYQLLSQEGISGVSVDEISRRSGVSKTTIYRHWPTRNALLLEACSQIGSRPSAPDTGTFKGDVTALAGALAQNLRTARWATVLPSIVDAAERDVEIARVQARLQAAIVEPILEVVARAKKRGELPRTRNAADVAAAIVGPLYYRRWFSREPLDDRFVKSIVRSVAA